MLVFSLKGLKKKRENGFLQWEIMIGQGRLVLN